MSVDLTVVCLQRPDFEVCDRLAQIVLSSLDPPIDLSRVAVFEVPPGYHEFGERHVIGLEAQSREAPTYVAMLVLSRVIAALHLGEVIDEASFFPAIGVLELFRLSLGGSLSSAEALWNEMRGSGS